MASYYRGKLDKELDWGLNNRLKNWVPAANENLSNQANAALAAPAENKRLILSIREHLQIIKKPPKKSARIPVLTGVSIASTHPRLQPHLIPTTLVLHHSPWETLLYREHGRGEAMGMGNGCKYLGSRIDGLYVSFSASPLIKKLNNLLCDQLTVLHCMTSKPLCRPPCIDGDLHHRVGRLIISNKQKQARISAQLKGQNGDIIIVIS
ncbi:hypothetical protein F5Y09DRAFT_94661 [Xylaria sp. FL1042]|nr:hypothetical protein F5Y09DRAFT_94661 [Xylaria sp. FL1042]